MPPLVQSTRFRSFSSLVNRLEKADLENNTKKSIEWFRQQMRSLQIVTERKILNSKELEQKARPLAGRMYFFGYDPKHKDTLPYYDRFPLIIMVGPAKGGFYGLNLHYLSPKQRAIFFDALRFRFAAKNKNEELTRFVMNFAKLKDTPALAAFAPCWKHYLSENIRTRIMKVPSEYWEPSLFLPCESFVGTSKKGVWNKSKKQFTI
jgi:hypothetical protein